MARRKDDLHVTVDREILEAARRKRKVTGRNLSHVVGMALRRWIAEGPRSSDLEAINKRH